MPTVVVSGSFDDLRCRHVRLLHEASRLGPVRVLLWSDEMVAAHEGKPPAFPQEERLYFVQSLRYVCEASIVSGPDDAPAGVPTCGVWIACPAIPGVLSEPAAWARRFDRRELPEADLQGSPEPDLDPPAAGRKKVIVTGCFDWLHTGHVRFFEEACEHGELYVVVGHDANLRLLKGEGHPLFPEEERRYLVQSVRFVHRALISSGTGWMDAAPEIARIRPDIYIVNEDGDKPEKRAFCEQHGLEYRVLRRLPKEGLPRRQSTDLRGF